MSVYRFRLERKIINASNAREYRQDKLTKSNGDGGGGRDMRRCCLPGAARWLVETDTEFLWEGEAIVGFGEHEAQLAVVVSVEEKGES